ncbi:D-alanyl-D-alanine carboxypeptidase family protein [Candidatus Sororendozoicomonas aggregata]|uniref:D-alanyl-D-alanine carboxypeptidase family protein n=1 Tax=Candidatus Sororendozoicomonas aggregata TaxID=3073239 RepID=UPI002ED25F68
MTKFLSPARRFAGLLALIFCVSASLSQAQTAMIPSPPELAVKSYVLMDADSGEVLASDNPEERLHPASLTKMMTAYIAEVELAAGNIKMDGQALISKKAWSMGGSTMFLEVGDKVSVSDLLHGIIIASGNDASVAMAEHIAGTEDAFVQMMNGTAKRLGMKNTHFANAAGWPAQDHYSTAYDLALLAAHIVKDYPENYPIYSQKYYQYGVDKRTGEPLDRQANRNSLLWTNPYVDGLKTGHIEATGYHLAVTGKKEGQRLIAVLLGAKSEKQRSEEAQKLLTYGFRFYENVDIKKGGEALQTTKVWKGSVNEITLGIDKDLIVSVPRGTGKNLKASMEVDTPLIAPITKGQKVGTVKVTQDNNVIKEVPLLAQQAVDKGAFFKRLWDSIVLFFTGLIK